MRPCALPFISMPDQREEWDLLRAVSCMLMTAGGFYGRGRAWVEKVSQKWQCLS